MAFCNNCGAYIPDGQTACLACGYDEAAEAEKTAAAAAAAAAKAQPKEEKQQEDTGKYYSFSNEELREKLEEQRRKQQETSRKWAEQEKARRNAAAAGKKSTEQNFDTVEEMGEKAKAAVDSFAKDSKLLSALSYVGILFVLPFILAKENRFAQYHAKQGAVLFLYSVLLRILKKLPVIGVVFRLFYWYCLYKGMSNALNGKKEPLPYIGQLGEKF